MKIPKAWISRAAVWEQNLWLREQREDTPGVWCSVCPASAAWWPWVRRHRCLCSRHGDWAWVSRSKVRVLILLLGAKWHGEGFYLLSSLLQHASHHGHKMLQWDLRDVLCLVQDRMGKAGVASVCLCSWSPKSAAKNSNTLGILPGKKNVRTDAMFAVISCVGKILVDVTKM